MAKTKKRKTEAKKSHPKPNPAPEGAKSNGTNLSFSHLQQKQQLYRSNIKALALQNPELAKRLETVSVVNYETVPSAPGKAPNLKMKTRGSLYYKGDNPQQDVKEQLTALQLKNNRMAVFLGLGLGYELIYYAEQMSREQNTAYILMIEKDLELFKLTLQTSDISGLLGSANVTFMVGLPEQKLYVELRNYLAKNSRFMYLKAMKPVYHPSALATAKEYYLNALKHLRESGAHQVLYYGNDPHDSIIGVENMLDNINEIVFNPGVNLLYDKFKGRPAVVVSSGPSLNKNKQLLKGLEDKALIVTAEASLRLLLDMGFKPHLVTSLERPQMMARLFEGIKAEEVPDVYLAACPVVHNDVYKIYPGPRVIVYRNFDHFKWLGIERGILDIKESAGNMAFKVAEALGCHPIILIGQDLAFSRDGDTHADGMVLGKKQEKYFSMGILEVKGNDGLPIKTTKPWYSFLKSYEVDIAAYDGRCINSTEGGAYIEGTEVMPFREAIDKYIGEAFDPLSLIKTNLANFTPDEAENDYASVSALIEGTLGDMQAIAENCRQGLELYKRHKEVLIRFLSEPEERRPDKAVINEIYAKLLEPKTRSVQDYNHTFQLFFMHILQSFSIKFEMEQIAIPEKHQLHEMALAEMLLKHSEWYSVVGDLTKILIDLLERSRGLLKSKAAETPTAAIM